jgi:type I restriction enzyme S subunit
VSIEVSALTPVPSNSTIQSDGKYQRQGLPSGWQWTTVGESIAIIDYRGRTPPFDGSVIPHIRSQNVKSGRIIWQDLVHVSEKTFAAFMTRGLPQQGDLLFTTEAPMGDVAPVPADRFSVAQRIMILRPAPSLWFSPFLMYQLMSPEFQAQIRTKGTGTTVTGVSSRNFKPIPLRVAPLDEQRRIVAEIEKQLTRLEAGVAGLRRVQANLKRYRAAVLKAACEGKLVPTEAERWLMSTLETVLTKIEAGKSFRCEERPPLPTEVGVVKVSAVTWGTFDERETKTCVDRSRVDERYFIRPGDFLFSRANTIDLVGACVIASTVTLKLMLSDKILRFGFTEAVMPQWVLYWLRAEFGRKEIQRLSTGNQESMRNIGQDRIRQISIAIPPLAEQQRIVGEVERRLSVVEELEAVVNANLQRATRLRQSILQRAFNGELWSPCI